MSLSVEELDAAIEAADRYPPHCGYRYFHSEKNNEIMQQSILEKMAETNLNDGWPAVAVAAVRCKRKQTPLNWPTINKALSDVISEFSFQTDNKLDYYNVLNYDPRTVSTILKEIRSDRVAN